MRCFRSCPITTSRCRPASMRIFGRSRSRPRCPSSCTTSPPGPSASCPTTRWRGWRNRRSSSDCGMARAIITRPLRLRSLLPPGFRLLSGDDLTALAFIANGGDGCISLVSNVAPDLCQAIFSSCRQGRLQSARYLQSRLAPLTAALTKESPAALKYALSLLGFMSPATRLPIVELADAGKAEVASAIAEIGDEDLACPRESWHRRRFHGDATVTAMRGIVNEFKCSRERMARQNTARLAAGDAALRRDIGQCRQTGRHGNRRRDRQAWRRSRASRTSAFSAGPVPNCAPPFCSRMNTLPLSCGNTLRGWRMIASSAPSPPQWKLTSRRPLWSANRSNATTACGRGLSSRSNY